MATPWAAATKERVITAGRWRSRRAKARLVRRAMQDWGDVQSLLLVGAGQGWTPLDTVVERAAAEGVRTVVATDLHGVTQVPWPYVRADALRLPFRDGAFDVVLSNAVIEHVGDAAAQAQFVREHLRIARRFVITTPNRWFPVETHTRALLRHWSGPWRDRQGHEFSRLLSRRELAALLPAGTTIQGRFWNSTFLAAAD